MANSVPQEKTSFRLANLNFFLTDHCQTLKSQRFAFQKIILHYLMQLQSLENIPVMRPIRDAQEHEGTKYFFTAVDPRTKDGTINRGVSRKIKNILKIYFCGAHKHVPPRDFP